MTQSNKSLQQWLIKNQSNRMDANIEIFPEDRRKFHLARYEFARQFCLEKRVLDGACGTGYGTAIIGQSAKETIGIDCSKDAIEYATLTYAKPHIGFTHSFVELTPFESDFFDVVVSFETIEHTLCPQSHVMEITRLLEPHNGMAVLSVPNSWGLTDHHFLDFNIDLLKTTITPYFSDMEFFYQNPEFHKNLPGIGLLTSSARWDAQCILVICRGPKKTSVVEQAERQSFIMDEIYRTAFSRHADYLKLMYRNNTNFIKRIYNKLRTII